MNTDQLSQSAAFIAVKFYGLSRIKAYRSLFDEETVAFYENVVRQLPRPLCYYHYWLSFKSVRRLYIRSEELLLPGDLMHILARKWYINRMIDNYRTQAYKQVLILGGGFDHQSLRLSGLGIRALEVDSPRMADLKKELLNSCYPKLTHPEIYPMHLPGRSLAEVLQQQQHLSPHKKTIVIAEGFFDYLSSGTVEGILETVKNFFGQPALISTHFALDELSAFHRTVFRASLRLVGEKLQFNTSLSEFENLLDRHGFQHRETIGTDEIGQDFLSPLQTCLPVLNGFYLCRAC